MNISETRKGELAILFSTVLWGLTPVIVLLSYGSVGPLTSLAFTTLLAAGFFAIVITFKKGWNDFLKPGVFKYLALIALFIGILYYSIYFVGLKYTTAGNASLILLMEVFFNYLFFNIWKKEAFSAAHILGSLFMLVGASVVLLKDFSGFNKGDIIVLLANLFSPAGNYFQQKLRKQISSEAILFGRNLITVPFVFFLALLFREKFSLPQLGQSFWYLLISGFLLLGFCKFLWVEGIHRISVTKASALEAIGPLFTLLFAYLILRQAPTVWQLASFFPLAAGLVLLTYEKSPKAGVV